MKIAQFSDSFLPIVDGVGRVSYNYAHYLAKAGQEVSVIAPMEDYGYRGNYNFEIIDYLSTSLPARPEYQLGAPILDIHYRERLKHCHFDIVHLHTPFIAGIEAVIYAKEHNIPSVTTFHSRYKDDFMQLTRGHEHLANIGIKEIIALYNRCDEVWTVSNSSAEALRSYGYKKDIFIMPNGMEIKEIPDSLAIKVKEHYNIASKPILLYVGQLNFKKNIDKTLKALALLKQQGLNFTYILAGKGPHEKEIRQLIKELQLEDNCLLTGHILDESLLYGLYKAADLFVFPSLYDTSGMVVKEAAIAFTPSVVVEGSAAGENIIDGYNGYLCKENPEDLAEAIAKALSDEEKLKAVGENARKTIPISWEEISSQVIDRYQYLIKKRQN